MIAGSPRTKMVVTTLVVVLRHEATHLPWRAVPGKVATTNGSSQYDD
jgi:hypothetical protein